MLDISKLMKLISERNSGEKYIRAVAIMVYAHNLKRRNVR
jgi:hypothetical protein